MSPRAALFIGAILGATGVAAGAIGSHLLEKPLAPQQFEQYQIAVRYQMIHALLLVGVAVLGRFGGSAWLTAAAWLLVLGTLFFSGCFYADLAAQAFSPSLRFFVHLVPLGGTMLIAGWLALAGHALRRG